MRLETVQYESTQQKSISNAKYYKIRSFVFAFRKGNKKGTG